MLAQFFDLAAHLLDLTLQELLLELNDLLRVLGAHELLGEVEGGVDGRLGEADRLAVDFARAGPGRFGGSLYAAVEAGRLANVLVDGLPGLSQGALGRLPDALRRIGSHA